LEVGCIGRHARVYHSLDLLGFFISCDHIMDWLKEKLYFMYNGVDMSRHKTRYPRLWSFMWVYHCG
jgi:hypothetical protein